MTKPTGTSGQGKCGGCALKAHVLIRGDLSDVAVRSRVVGNQPGPLVDEGPGARGAAAPCERSRQRTREEAQRATEQSASVSGQKSAEAILAAPSAKVEQ